MSDVASNNWQAIRLGGALHPLVSGRGAVSAAAKLALDILAGAALELAGAQRQLCVCCQEDEAETRRERVRAEAAAAEVAGAAGAAEAEGAAGAAEREGVMMDAVVVALMMAGNAAARAERRGMVVEVSGRAADWVVALQPLLAHVPACLRGAATGDTAEAVDAAAAGEAGAAEVAAADGIVHAMKLLRAELEAETRRAQDAEAALAAWKQQQQHQQREQREREQREQQLQPQSPRSPRSPRASTPARLITQRSSSALAAPRSTSASPTRSSHGDIGGSATLQREVAAARAEAGAYTRPLHSST